MLASLFSVGLYLVGHLTRDLRALGAQSDSRGRAQATAVRSTACSPTSRRFNLTIQAVHGLPIPAAEVVWLPLATGSATPSASCSSPC